MNRKPLLHVIDGGAAGGGWRSFLNAPLRAMSIGEWFELQLEELHRRESKSETDFRKMYHWLPDTFRNIQLADLTHVEIVAWVKWLRSRTKEDGQKLAAKTVNKYFTLLKSVLQSAAAEGLMQTNPAAGLPRGTLPPNKPRASFDPARQILSIPEASRLISAPVPLAQRTIYAVGILAGLRIGEICGLRWGDWEECFLSDTGLLTVAGQWSRERRKLDTTKTGDHRGIPVHAELAKLLRLWREAWPKAIGRKPRNADLMFAVYGGSIGRKRADLVPKNQTIIRRQFKKTLERLDLRQRVFHSLRKSFISIAVNAGADREAIMSCTHRSSNAVQTAYLAWSFERVAAEIAKIPVREIEGGQLGLFEGPR